MASVRAQILAAIRTKLETVRLALGWDTLLVNPREPFGEDQLNAIALLHGGDREPSGLTGHVELREMDLTVAWVVLETTGFPAEDLLDAGYVAISDALLDPADIQLGGLASAISQGVVSDPIIGRGLNGARVIGAQSIEFTVQYLAREGDASTRGP